MQDSWCRISCLPPSCCRYRNQIFHLYLNKIHVMTITKSNIALKSPQLLNIKNFEWILLLVHVRFCSFGVAPILQLQFMLRFNSKSAFLCDSRDNLFEMIRNYLIAMCFDAMIYYGHPCYVIWWWFCLTLIMMLRSSVRWRLRSSKSLFAGAQAPSHVTPTYHN